MQQSQLVGQWDTMLQRNGDRIITLHDQVDKLKTDQKKWVIINVYGCTCVRVSHKSYCF